MSADYTLTVDTITGSNSITNSTSHFCGSWCDHNTTYFWGYPYYTPVTIYKYQVKCPKCKTSNWLELDKIEPCRKCSSTLKAVSKTVDYEIGVED